MVRKVYLLIVYLCFTSAFSKDIHLEHRGIIGDGLYDNWLVIQTAIDEVLNDGGGTVYFPKGEFAIYNKTLIIWGSNITLKGENPEESIIVKKGKAGYFGDCLGIVGKINNYFYYGSFGLKDYNENTIYLGENIQSENIFVECLGITTSLDGGMMDKANNVGILNSANVFFKDCIISNAPQSNVAVVNDTNSTLNKDIYFVGCEFINSRQHNVRVSSYNKGNFIGNKVSFIKCSFLNVQSPDIYQKEILGYQLHLWYRGIGSKDENQVRIEDCVFDDTGFIYCNGINTNLNIFKSKISSFMFVQTPKSAENSKVVIKNSEIAKHGEFGKILYQKTEYNRLNNMKCGFIEVPFGIQYPCK